MLVYDGVRCTCNYFSNMWAEVYVYTNFVKMLITNFV